MFLDDDWDTPCNPSEAATKSYGDIIAKERWNGFTHGCRATVVGSGLKVLDGKKVEFLCHRHVRGESRGWVDVYYARKQSIFAVPESAVRR